MKSVLRVCGFLSCALLVVVLICQPSVLQTVSPGWQQTWGLALFAVAGVFSGIQIWRTIKVLIGMLAWGGMALVIGLAVLGDKLPVDFFDRGLEDVKASITQYVSKDLKARAQEVLALGHLSIPD